MTFKTITSREFNQHASEAKKAADDGPVFITDRGKPAHVLLSIQEYQRLTGQQINLAQALAQKDSEMDFDFEAPRINLPLQPVVFDRYF